MNKIKYSDFETIEDIMKTIDLGYNKSKDKNLECLKKIWIEVAGEKISKISQIYDILKDDILLIVCMDSYISNELYLEKETLLSKLREKTQNLGIKIEDIKFDYRKWKEKSNE